MALTWVCPARRASHLEQDWRQDGFKKLPGGLAQHFTLVHWDRPGDDWTLFLTQYGEPFSNEGLSRRVKKYIDRANLNKTGSCHLFRHAMATHMLENGADIRYIQELLGHSKLETTQVYTQVSILKLKEIHKATHPAKVEKVEGRETK